MRVNSVSERVFTNWMVARTGIVVVLMMCACAAFGSDTNVVGTRGPEAETPLGRTVERPGLTPGEKEMRMKQVNLLIRLIGYQLLLQAGDSTSRVLPVTEIKEGIFTLQVENQFLFSHDSLISLSQRYFPKKRFPADYTVTVHDCGTASIVYGFQINNNTPDILACQGRHEPKGCYLIEFAFADLYASTKSGNDDPAIQKRKSSRQQTNPKTEALLVEPETNALAEKLSSYKTDTNPVIASRKKLKASTSAYPFMSLLYSSVLISLGITLVLARVGMFLKPKDTTDTDDQATEIADAEFTSLGKFEFDVKGQRLLSANDVVTLTEKECKILELLYNNFGELVTRETLTQKIWLDEGVITGRSLDMFVSKLRKKLSADPALKITNVHGKGYRLE